MAADARSHGTKGAGIVNHDAPSRAGTNVRSAASGHGTRPIHAATAHVQSASATPIAGGIDRRESWISPNPASIQPAHCQPAERSRARIASFLDEVVGACRASAISTDDWASASAKRIVPHRPLPRTVSTGSSAMSANAGVAGCPSIAAPSSKSALARAVSWWGAAVGVALRPSAASTLSNPHSNGVGPAPSGPSSTYRLTKGCSSASVASMALLKMSGSPRPSRCCRRSSDCRACVSRSGAKNAFRMRSRASVSATGIRDMSTAVPDSPRRQSRSRRSGSTTPP